MSTNIYLVRHAESVYRPEDDNYSRPLSEKGKEEAKNLVGFFRGININKVISSPYIRAVQTVEGVAKNQGLGIELIDDFRERTVADYFLDDQQFVDFVKTQWQNFDYYLEGGESFNQVQERGIRGLKKIIQQEKNQNIIIGTHGTWLAVILNYYDKKYNYDFWKTIQMPDVFLLKFQGDNLTSINHVERG